MKTFFAVALAAITLSLATACGSGQYESICFDTVTVKCDGTVVEADAGMTTDAGNNPFTGETISFRYTAPSGEHVRAFRFDPIEAHEGLDGPYWDQSSSLVDAGSVSFLFDMPGNARRGFFNADLSGGGWACEGFTDSGSTAATVRGSFSDLPAGCDVRAWHRPNAVHTNGCAVLIDCS